MAETDILARVDNLEKEMTKIKNMLRRKKALTLKEKLLIHDRAKCFETQWYSLKMPEIWEETDKVTKIITGLVELVDAALGVTP